MTDCQKELYFDELGASNPSELWSMYLVRYQSQGQSGMCYTTGKSTPTVWED
jgi:hypothetical protein